MIKDFFSAIPVKAKEYYGKLSGSHEEKVPEDTHVPTHEVVTRPEDVKETIDIVSKDYPTKLSGESSQFVLPHVSEGHEFVVPKVSEEEVLDKESKKDLGYVEIKTPVVIVDPLVENKPVEDRDLLKDKPVIL